MSDPFFKLKNLLNEQYQWPAVYTFKFIVGPDDVQKVIDLIDPHEHSLKESRSGKYISVTAKKMIQKTHEVIEIYKSVSSIEGVISL